MPCIHTNNHQSIELPNNTWRAHHTPISKILDKMTETMIQHVRKYQWAHAKEGKWYHLIVLNATDNKNKHFTATWLHHLALERPWHHYQPCSWHLTQPLKVVEQRADITKGMIIHPIITAKQQKAPDWLAWPPCDWNTNTLHLPTLYPCWGVGGMEQEWAQHQQMKGCTCCMDEGNLDLEEWVEWCIRVLHHERGKWNTYKPLNLFPPLSILVSNILWICHGLWFSDSVWLMYFLRCSMGFHLTLLHSRSPYALRYIRRCYREAWTSLDLVHTFLHCHSFPTSLSIWTLQLY